MLLIIGVWIIALILLIAHWPKVRAAMSAAFNSISPVIFLGAIVCGGAYFLKTLFVGAFMFFTTLSGGRPANSNETFGGVLLASFGFAFSCLVIAVAIKSLGHLAKRFRKPSEGRLPGP